MDCFSETDFCLGDQKNQFFQGKLQKNSVLPKRHDDTYFFLLYTRASGSDEFLPEEAGCVKSTGICINPNRHKKESAQRRLSFPVLCAFYLHF